MTNALITIDGKTSDTDIMFLTGQVGFDNEETAFSGPYGILKVNSAFEEDTKEVTAEGKKVYRRLPSGSFVLSLPKLGRVFSDAVSFRVLQRGFQYAVYDAEKNKLANRSRIINNFNEEAYDETGTLKCGSVAKKNREGLTPEQKKKQEGIKCTQMLYGLVTFINPVDINGNKVDAIADVPVLFRTNGSNFKITGDLIDELTTKKKIMACTPIVFTTERQQNGSVVYYTLVPKVDYVAGPVWRGAEDIDILTMFKADIKKTNDEIYVKYVAAMTNKQSAQSDANLMAVISPKSSKLSNDFIEDELPFDLTNTKPSKKSKSDMLMAG